MKMLLSVGEGIAIKRWNPGRYGLTSIIIWQPRISGQPDKAISAYDAILALAEGHKAYYLRVV